MTDKVYTEAELQQKLRLAQAEAWDEGWHNCKWQMIQSAPAESRDGLNPYDANTTAAPVTQSGIGIGIGSKTEER